MAKAIELKTTSGKIIYVEVEENFEPLSPSPDLSGGAVAGGIEPTKAIEKFDEIGLTIANVCSTLQNKVIEAIEKTKPNELTFEFGVKLAGEAGIPLVTKGSAEGTFQVTVKWNFNH